MRKSPPKPPPLFAVVCADGRVCSDLDGIQVMLSREYAETWRKESDDRVSIAYHNPDQCGASPHRVVEYGPRREKRRRERAAKEKHGRSK